MSVLFYITITITAVITVQYFSVLLIAMNYHYAKNFREFTRFKSYVILSFAILAIPVSYFSNNECLYFFGGFSFLVFLNIGMINTKDLYKSLRRKERILRNKGLWR